MSNMYKVSLLDVIKSKTNDDGELRDSVKAFFVPILSVFLILDVLDACLLFSQVHDWSWRKMSAELTGPVSFLLSFKTGTFDCAALALARAFLFPLLTYIAVVYGRPRYDVKSTAGAFKPPMVKREEQEYLRLDVPVQDDDTEVDQAAHRANLEAGDQERQAAKTAAQRRKYGVLLVLFVLSTLSQVYLGIKVSAYNPTPAGQPREALGEFTAILMCLSVLWVNAEIWACRHIISELTKEEGLFLPNVHQHPVFYESSVACHYCDLCSTRIVTGAWRCKLCDFDLCEKCASRKDATEVGENVLRSDTGVVKEGSVSGTDYLKRAVQLATPQWQLVTFSFALLTLYCGTQIILPHFQGSIIDNVVKVDEDSFYENIKFYVIVMALQGTLSALYSACFAQVSRQLVFHVRNTLFGQILRQDVAFFDGTTSGHLTSRLTNDVNMMMQPIQSSLSQLLQNILMLFGGLIMCYYTSYQLSMLAFVTVGPIMYC